MIYPLATMLAILWALVFSDYPISVVSAILLAAFIYSYHDNGE